LAELSDTNVVQFLQRVAEDGWVDEAAILIGILQLCQDA